MKQRIGGILLALAVTVALGVPAVPAAAHVEVDPMVKTLYAGQDIDVGTVSVWNDGEELHVTYNTTDGWEIMETHLHVATSVGDIPQSAAKGPKKGANGNPIPGKFMRTRPHDPPVTGWEEVFDLEDEGWPVCTDLYIAAHAVVVRPIPDCSETVWQIGEVEERSCDEETTMSNWADEFNWGDPAGPCTAGPGLAADMPSYTDPFVVGTTPESEFPFNSNASGDYTYATDFDVKWSGALPFGGKLTISWSPGKSAEETKVVSGDGISSTTFIRQGDEVTGEGLFLDSPVYEDSTNVDPVSSGVHTIRFQHTTGDGTSWDWIRLEKPCEQEETAWADGQDFDGNNWATYFEYKVQEECVVEGTVGTGWPDTAYDHAFALIAKYGDADASSTEEHGDGGCYPELAVQEAVATGNDVLATDQFGWEDEVYYTFTAEYDGSHTASISLNGAKAEATSSTEIPEPTEGEIAITVKTTKKWQEPYTGVYVRNLVLNGCSVDPDSISAIKPDGDDRAMNHIQLAGLDLSGGFVLEGEIMLDWETPHEAFYREAFGMNIDVA